MSALSTWMTSTPGLTARSNPRLSLPVQSSSRGKKLAVERGLFDGGRGLRRDVAVRTHTSMFINITQAHTLAQTTLTNVQKCRLQPPTWTCMQLRSTLSSVVHTWAGSCKRLTLPCSSSLSYLPSPPIDLSSSSVSLQRVTNKHPPSPILPHDSYQCACCVLHGNHRNWCAALHLTQIVFFIYISIKLLRQTKQICF